MARFFIRRWHLHDEMALFIGTAIVVVLAITLINGVLSAASSPAPTGCSSRRTPPPGTASLNRSNPNGPAAQRLSRRGTPSGYQGRNFVATGPHADELTRLNGRPAKEPIRVYAGLQTADTDEEPDGASCSANSNAPARSTARCW